MLQYAKDKGHFISFDPNYRSALITNTEQFSQDCLTFIKHAHFVKVSQEEATMLSKESDLQQAALKLLNYGAKVVAITLGKDGTLLATNEGQTIVSSISIQQVDTTGAGDAFVGAMLYQIAQSEHTLSYHFKDLTAFISFANKVGAITCTNYGAIASSIINRYKSIRLIVCFLHSPKIMHNKKYKITRTAVPHRVMRRYILFSPSLAFTNAQINPKNNIKSTYGT